MKRTAYLPTIILAMALLTAGVLVIGGLRLAREETVEKMARDPQVADRFFDQLRSELERLELRYTTHLAELANATVGAGASPFELEERAEAIWGVRRVSLLRRSGQAQFHIHMDDHWGEASIPHFSGYAPLPGLRAWPLDRDTFAVGFPGASGWEIRASDEQAAGSEEMLFWQIPYGDQNSSIGRVAVITIDRAEVVARIDAWLADWLIGLTPPMSSGDESAAEILIGPGNSFVVAGSQPHGSPDRVKSLPTRFGEWQLRSWDTRKTVVQYDRRVINWGVTLALLVVAAGVYAFFELRRALRIAAQRVSFVNQVSHELRTPLTNILLNADLAVDGASSSGKRRLALVRDEAERLRRLIDNVLSFSARRRGDATEKVSRDLRCEVAQVIDKLLSQYSTALRRKGIEIEAKMETQACAAASADGMAQIVGNLISNVEKYAAVGGLLQVKTWSEGEEVVVRVADRGPGIARSQRERIFEAFQRLDDRVTEGSSGTGLGLSIARNLAEDFGGSLRLVDGKADSGVGAVFELRLPLADESITVIDFPRTQAS